MSRLEELKLGKQEEVMKSCPKTAKVSHDKEDSDSEFSSESDKGSMNDGEHCGTTGHSNKAEASVELKGEVCQFCTQYHVNRGCVVETAINNAKLTLKESVGLVLD